MQKPFDEMPYEIQPGDIHNWECESTGAPPGCFGIAWVRTTREGATKPLTHTFDTKGRYSTSAQAEREARMLMNDLRQKLNSLQFELDRTHGKA